MLMYQIESNDNCLNVYILCCLKPKKVANNLIKEPDLLKIFLKSTLTSISPRHLAAMDRGCGSSNTLHLTV